MSQTLVLGGPGCGKTTELIRIIEGYLSKGVKPNRIGYLAFTRKAANEARDRVMKKFGFDEEDIPYFRTIHSLAFKALGVGADAVMNKKLFTQFAEYAGLELSVASEDDFFVQTTQDDKAIAALSLARITRRPLEDVCFEMGVAQNVVEFVRKEMEYFKDQRVVIDYTDMLESFLVNGTPPQLDVLIIDEAQDLSRLQWDVVEMLARHVNDVYIAGDDDQAIYEWAGADVDYFLALQGRRQVLPRSYRLKSSVYGICQKIISQVAERFPKDWKPDAQGGRVETMPTFNDLDLSTGTWYILARNRHILRRATNHLRRNGLPFIENGKSTVEREDVQAILHWEALRKGREISGRSAGLVYAWMKPHHVTQRPVFDPGASYDIQSLRDSFGLQTTDDWRKVLDIKPRDRDYFSDIKARGESLIDRPRITVSTIHGVKGGEAENVVIIPDMTKSSHEAYRRNSAAEARTFFVGASRAKENLFFMAPQTSRYWNASHVI